MKLIKITCFAVLSIIISNASFAASVIATVGNNPITDADITARVQLMNKQGQVSTDNRRKALQNIIDDYIKLEYAQTLKIRPSDADIKKQIDSMNLGELTPVQKSMAKMAVSSDIAWQMVIGRTIAPTIDVDDSEIAAEKSALESEKGLPIEITMLNLIDIPKDVSEKLKKPDSCDDAIKIAKDLGGAPQKIVAKQYELSADVLKRIAGLPELTWSKWADSSVFLICSKKKTEEYGKLDEIIKQNAIYKKAMFTADQQLKQLKRKAVIVINDNRYKL